MTYRFSVEIEIAEPYGVESDYIADALMSEIDDALFNFSPEDHDLPDRLGVYEISYGPVPVALAAA